MDFRRGYVNVTAMYNFLKGRLVVVRLCLLVTALMLVAIGILTLYGIGHPVDSSQTGLIEKKLGGYWQDQLKFAGLGVIGLIAVNLINYRRFGEISYWIFALGLVALAYLMMSRYIKLPFAPEINDSHRWLIFHDRLPAVQPSEFFKLAYILTLAWYLRYRSNYRNFKALIGPFVLTLLPMFLILLEPDLGTVLLMMPVFFMMLFIAGAKSKHLLIIILMAALVSPLLWGKMRSYQRIRISSVLLQSTWIREKAEKHEWLGEILVGTKFTERKWETDWGYHLIRSKYAIASGGINSGAGYGYRRGPFVRYNFLGERHNDFIFSIIAQQWGFWGCLVLLMLYMIIIACGLKIAANNTDPFGRLLAVGIVVMFTMAVIVNIGMTMGIMPITGLTLPLISYGGSSLLVNIAAIGLLNNVGRCRPFSLARKT